MDRHTDYIVLDGEMGRKEINEYISTYLCDHNGETYSKLTMRKGFCGDEEGAKKWLDSYRKGEQSMCEAIKYIIHGHVEPSDEEKRLAEKGKELGTAYHDLEEQEYLETITFDRFRCPNCDCEFPHDVIMARVRSTFGRNQCPMCRKDYRPQELLDEIEKRKHQYYEQEWEWESLNSKRKTEERKLDRYKWVLRLVWYDKTS